jgi:hypothetical protein
MLKAIWSKIKENLLDDTAHDPFVTFIQVAREAPEIRNTLTAILKENDFNRESILNTYIEEMRFKGAPESFVASLSRLLDKEVAQRALELLDEDP